MCVCLFVLYLPVCDWVCVCVRVCVSARSQTAICYAVSICFACGWCHCVCNKLFMKFVCASWEPFYCALHTKRSSPMGFTHLYLAFPGPPWANPALLWALMNTSWAFHGFVFRSNFSTSPRFLLDPPGASTGPGRSREPPKISCVSRNPEKLTTTPGNH